MEALLDSLGVLAPLLLAPLISLIVQAAKRLGLDPFVGLGLFSVLAATLYMSIRQFLSPEYWEWFVMFTLSIAGVANVIYSVVKRYYPGVRSK